MRYVKSLKPAWQSSKFCLQHILVPGYFASLPTLRNHGTLEFVVHFKPCSFSAAGPANWKKLRLRVMEMCGETWIFVIQWSKSLCGMGEDGGGRTDGFPTPFEWAFASFEECRVLQTLPANYNLLNLKWHFYGISIFFSEFAELFFLQSLQQLSCILWVRGTAFWDSWVWFSTKAFSGVQWEDTRQGRNVSGRWLICCSGIKLWGKIWTCM